MDGKTLSWGHTRFTQIGREGRVPELPDPRIRFYRFIDYLMEAGPTSFDAMGNERPLSWGEINDYHAATEKLPAPWMREMVKWVGEAYLEGKLLGKDPLGRSPFELKRVAEDESGHR